MATRGADLRELIDRWLQPGDVGRVHVARFGRTPAGRVRFVLIEISRSGGTVGLYFFRQPDRTWGIAPPLPPRPAMRLAEAGEGAFGDTDIAKFV
ncbi:hypothetical protein UC34_07055 [Pandoraea vervacti]|uniref:Uncharacterized protein n=1 Tax=Pandoraea vervacti TaxID=656178 RepID=A0ABM5SWD6_9BURK|nr:hypothetical protein UC34_07055 [Pandoraea vervacti]